MISPPPALNSTFSDLWVGPWNGLVPGDKPEAESAPATVALVNGDDVQGRIESATSAFLKMESEVGPLELPVERITMVDFGEDAAPPTPIARIYLAGQGSISVFSWRIENGMLTCQNGFLGEIKLPITDIREIVFPPSAGSPEAE